MRATTRSLRGSSLAASVALAVLVGSGTTVLSAQGDGTAEAMHRRHDRDHRALVITDQGARAFGGTILGDFATASIHCDHGYVEWQIPAHPRKVPLLMWHSSSTKTWETTFDGRQGFKNIFLRRGFPVYIIDGPRIGRANWGCAEYTYTPDIGRDQAQVSTWRLGLWTPPAPPQFFPNVQFPTDDEAALDQLFRGRYLEFETIPNAQLETDEVAKLVDEIGPVTILSHSGSGIRGWLTRLKSDKVAGIVAYEPAGFVFPAGELPPGDIGFDVEVSLARFNKLTEIPIQVVFGDNLDKVPFWVTVFARAQAFVEAVNRHGGDAQLLHLPEIGIFGNTHFAMSDLNNREVANLLSQFLREKGLAERGGHAADKDVATQ